MKWGRSSVYFETLIFFPAVCFIFEFSAINTNKRILPILSMVLMSKSNLFWLKTHSFAIFAHPPNIKEHVILPNDQTNKSVLGFLFSNKS